MQQRGGKRGGLLYVKLWGREAPKVNHMDEQRREKQERNDDFLSHKCTLHFARCQKATTAQSLQVEK